MGLAQANEWQDFAARLNDWENFVLEELPKFGVEGDKEKCLEYLAQKKVTAEILIQRVINLKENLEQINNSGKEVSFAHLLQYYTNRNNLIAHKEKSGAVTFLFIRPREELHTRLYCFARQEKND